MIKSKHNQYVSTPDWFSSKPQETIQTAQPSQSVIVSSSSDTIVQQEPLALHQLTDVASDENGVMGAVEGSVLKFDGTNWYGDKIDINIPEGGIEYLLKEVFSKIFTAYDINGNIVDITDVNSVINDISVNYSLWSKGYLSALGRQSDASSGSMGALYQLVDVLADGDKVYGAEEGSVLKYDGTHWYADKISFDGENYATIDWVLGKDYATNTSLRQLSDIVDTKWTQDDEKINNWDETYQKLNDWFYKDEDGYLHSRYGFVGDEFISTLGVSDDPINLPSGGITEVYWDDIKEKPTFSTVATTGNYNDLSGKPDLSSYQLAITSTNKLSYSLISGTPDLSVYALNSSLSNYQTKITSSNKLAYSLISGTPTIPTALPNPNKLTISTVDSNGNTTSKVYDGSSAVTLSGSELGIIRTVTSLPANPKADTLYILL